MKEVYPGIFQIEEKGAYGVVKPPENVFVFAGANGLIYDAGYGDKKSIKYIVKEIKKIGDLYKSQNKDFKITRVLPSHAHPDHISGSVRLKKILGVKIILTQKMANTYNGKKNFIKFFEPNREKDMLSVDTILRKFKDWVQHHLWRTFYYQLYGIKFIKQPDEIIEEKSQISINNEVWNIFPSPGHSPDHISLYNEEKGILFSGDNILRSVTTWLGPPHCDINDYVKSVEYIQKLPKLDLVIAAHGSPITNPKERIAEILKHRKERAQRVLDLVNSHAERGISPSEIVKEIYPGQSAIMQNTGRGWVCLTLKMFEQQGLVRREKTKKVFLFFPTINKN